MSTSTAAAADDHGGAAAPIPGLHPDIIQSHILTRLDGPTLAAASCASAALLSMCAGGDDSLWRRICHSTWPSTADPRVAAAITSHRSFFSDAFPATTAASALPADTPELISAVDIHYGGAPVYSKVLSTEARSPWFLAAPFRLDLLAAKEAVDLPDGGVWVPRAAEEGLRVSWIVVDPARGRAVSVARGPAVEAWRDWLSGDVRLRYVAAAEGEEAEVWCSVAVRCDGGRRRVKEVSLQVEDVEGRIVSGAEALRVLAAAMEGRRRRSDDGAAERASYDRFLGMKRRWRERKVRRERGLDTACAATGISIFLAFFVYLLWR